MEHGRIDSWSWFIGFRIHNSGLYFRVELILLLGSPKSMPETITISAKNLGAVAMPEFCPRCFWIQMHAEGIPFQIFPGIFSSIDAYSKRLVHGCFDCRQTAPAWLNPLGSVRGYRNPPHYSKFSILDPATNIILRGTPDGILVMHDNSHVIVDYKTAKFTPNQDELFPMYEV
jgi:hypothetical protein